MSTHTSQALAQRDAGPGQMIATYRNDFATVLPTHVRPETWVRLAQGALRRDKNLARVAQQNPASLMAALLDCARLGHEPGTEAYYLVPYGNEIQGIEGYRGVVERMYRAGAVSSVKAEVVYSADRFVFTPQMQRPVHEPDWFGDRGEVIGAYAYAEMVDGGTSRVCVINREYLDKVRKESRGSDKPSSPWVKWFDQMVLKTAAHRLEPWVPTSSEYLRDRARAQGLAAQTAQAAPSPAPASWAELTQDGHVDVITGELLDDPQDQAEVES